MAVPVLADLIAQVAEDEARLTGAMTRLLRGRAQEMTALGRGLPAPRRILEGAMQRVDDWAERLGPAFARVLRGKTDAVMMQGRQLVQPQQYVDVKARGLDTLVGRLVTAQTASKARFERDLRDVGSLGGRLQQAQARLRDGAEKRLASLSGLLESYSYKGVLERGFVLVRDASGAPVLSAGALAPGDGISLTFRDDGHVSVTVNEVGAGSSAPQPKPQKAKAAKPKPKSKAAPGDDPQGSLL